tara:strand:- start:10888 stop:11151 length:264 start_codon:yes stop_codon:yes gene_type:complete
MTLLLFSGVSISHEALKSVEEVQGKIGKWLKSSGCEIAIVKDLDLLEGKMLIKAKGIYFTLTSQGSSTFEICPIGRGVGKRPTLDPK